MPTEDSSIKRNIILRHSHDPQFRGMYFVVEGAVDSLVIPHICGCTSTFAPTGESEPVGRGGLQVEIWKQVGFVFREYNL